MEFIVGINDHDGDYALVVRVYDYQARGFRDYHEIVVNEEYRRGWPGGPPAFQVAVVPISEPADAAARASGKQTGTLSAQAAGGELPPAVLDLDQVAWRVTLADGRELREGFECRRGNVAGGGLASRADTTLSAATQKGYWPDIPEPIAQVELAGRIIKGAERYWFARRGTALLGGGNEVLFIEVGGVFRQAGLPLEIEGWRLHRNGTWEPMGYPSLEALSAEHFASVPTEDLPLKPGVRPGQ